MIGLYITGYPKVIGSLILKSAGIIPALATARSYSDLAFKPQIAAPIVLPVPPAHAMSPINKTGE